MNISPVSSPQVQPSQSSPEQRKPAEQPKEKLAIARVDTADSPDRKDAALEEGRIDIEV